MLSFVVNLSDKSPKQGVLVQVEINIQTRV